MNWPGWWNQLRVSSFCLYLWVVPLSLVDNYNDMQTGPNGKARTTTDLLIVFIMDRVT